MEAAEEAGDNNPSSKDERDEQRQEQGKGLVRVLSVEKVTVEKIVLESSSGTRQVLLTKNESRRKVAINSETERSRSSTSETGVAGSKKSQTTRGKRIKPIKLIKNRSIGGIVVGGGIANARNASDREVQKDGSGKKKGGGEVAEKLNAKNRLERSESNIEVLQRNLNTKIGANTARRYKEKLLELRESRGLKLAAIVDPNANESIAAVGKVAFDEEFLQKHNLDRRLKIEEYEVPRGDREHSDETRRTAAGAGYSEKVLEVEKRWSGEFLRDQLLDRHSSESSKSSYVEERESVSSRESVGEVYGSETLPLVGHDERERTRRRPESSPISIDLVRLGDESSEEILADSTVSTVDSDSCLEDRIKSLDEYIEARVRQEGDDEGDENRRDEEGEEEEKGLVDQRKSLSHDESIDRTRIVDGYANLIREFTMEPGSSSRAKKEEKQQKRKLGLRRLLPGFFSPKDSRKEYNKKKEGKERKRPDDRHFARHQQNGNYTRSPDTMNLNEDIKRNVKLDNSLNGSIIEERLDEIKRELFPEQGPITSTPDHLAREEDPGVLREHRSGPPRSYTTDSSLSSIAPDDRWNERNAQLGISPDIGKFEQRQKREAFEQMREYGQPLERKHSLQEPNQPGRSGFFLRNHGLSGRISAPPSERYLVRPRPIHPIDRPLPAIPHSRTDLSAYLPDREEKERPRRRRIDDGYDRIESSKSPMYRIPSGHGLYENDESSCGLILKSVSAQVKITRQPIVNQNVRAPLLGRSPKYLSSCSSQKYGDYGDSTSCTVNASQKSPNQFSPCSSKTSGEYYPHSPRDAGSPNGRGGTAIYENEHTGTGERIYDETPSSPCPCDEEASNSNRLETEDSLDKRAKTPASPRENPAATAAPSPRG
ncbi:uncharacterized protein LOC143426680 [Xylocopa sonorina]|uniref:uncharacterized protein LOC143426680 n=1 Tax=Xylocopa sonorina TaxID=1818115 RepID=UPI00403B1236